MPTKPSRLRPVALVALLAGLSFSAWSGDTMADEDPMDGRRAPSTGILLEAVTTDPQGDHNDDGIVSSSDESVTLWNAGSSAIDLTGWRLRMEDATVEEMTLDGTLAPGGRLHLMNPPGQMNNDVVLTLQDAGERQVDTLALGQSGYPSGDAGGLLDESIRLAGPWAATAGPYTAGAELAPLWVESFARTNATHRPFQAPWVAPGSTNLTFVVHHTHERDPGAYRVVLENQEVALTQEAGVWRAGPLDIPASGTIPLHLRGDNDTIAAYPNRDPLAVQVDNTGPIVPAGDQYRPAVNATGWIHWLPSFFDNESGVAQTSVEVTRQNATVVLSACAVPGLPASGCQLETPGEVMTVRAVNHAGAAAQQLYEPVWDDVPPAAPETWRVEEGEFPVVRWSPFTEPLQRLVLEIADDVTGVYQNTTHVLEPDQQQFIDAAWTPGAPRAYRLVATDRVGLQAANDWLALPPDLMPVHWRVAHGTEALAATAGGNQSDVVLRFDRPVWIAPTLVLDLHAPHVAHYEQSGTLAANGTEAVYPLPSPLPLWGNGTWRVTEGRSYEGAAFADAAPMAVWDLAPPDVRTTGFEHAWVQAERRVVFLEANDAHDSAPVLTLDPAPPGARYTFEGTNRVQIVLGREGLFVIRGNATDGLGNRLQFQRTVGLDGTAPIVRLAQFPAQWGPSAPIVLEATDGASGVNVSSLRVWVVSATEVVEVQDFAWNETTVTMSPPQGTNTTHPVRIHVAVADHAGNLAEGLVYPHVTFAAAPRVGQDEGRAPHGAPAPPAAGPAWGGGGQTASPRAANGTNGDTGVWPEPLRQSSASTTARPASNLLDWATVSLVVAGGGIGLGTVIKRSRIKARQKPSRRPDGI